MTTVQPTAYDLMQVHVQALFIHDERSRLLSINDGQEGVAPRIFLGRTEQGHVWRFRHDLPEALCAELESLCQTEPVTITEHPQHKAEYVRILAAQQPVERLWLGPAYWFPAGARLAQEPILISEQNAHLLQNGLQDWIPDVPTQQPFVAMIVAGQAVAICASVRVTGMAHEAGVETLKGHRQKGYATSVVSAWASAVMKRGAMPLYSTSLANVASQKVAARLGLSRYGIDFHIT